MQDATTYAAAILAAQKIGNLSAYVAGRTRWSRLDAAFATREFHRQIGTARAVRS